MSDPANICTLLVSCPDRRGIVAVLAQVLTGHGGNVLGADHQAGQSFRRVRFDLVELLTDRVTLDG